MITLGIETTCDETSASIVKNGKEILSLVTASSSEIHAKYGGVFPELACSRHIEAIIPVIDEAIHKAKITAQDIDLIAVAKGPGLIGALLIGMQVAKGLAIAWNKPLIGVNHVEAHLYASIMHQIRPVVPALGIVLSGGHTLLLKIHDVGNYEQISTTVDDAIGEAFDKVAILLGFPYPGGPHIEKLSKKGDPTKFPLKAGFVKRSPLDFSLSGIKTSVLYATKSPAFNDDKKADLAASFQETVFLDVIKKAKKVLGDSKAIYFGGGVCENRRLRTLFAENFENTPLFWPPQNLSLDNAAMIAGLGSQKFLKTGKTDGLDLEALPRIPVA
jgi:N6-L-threonylcarbamoyladenine synthase